AFYNGGGGAGMFATWDLSGATPASYVSGTPAGVVIPLGRFGDGTTPAQANANSVTKVGSGTLTLTGTMTYKGSTQINQGILSIGSASALTGTGGPISVNQAGFLSAAAGVTLPASQTITLDGGAIRNVSGDNTFSAPLKLI